MPIDAGIFGNDSNFDERFIADYTQLENLVSHVRGLGLRVVLTSGSFDLFHLGHTLYLEKAREYGDLMIVGVDDDEKIRRRKGEHRPFVPQDERLQILVRQRSVDVVTLKSPSHEHWELIRIVRPDVLIATQETYTPDEIHELEDGLCGKVEVLEPQAKTSTSARLRLLNLNLANQIAEGLNGVMPGVIQDVIDKAMGSTDKPKEG